ncbi:MAG: c-type cytochrome [Bacteroidia bacterium]
MKKILKISGIIIGLFLLFILSFGGYSAWKFENMPPLPVRPLAIKAVNDSSLIAHGQTITTAICAYCHMGEDGTLSGKIFASKEEGFGEIWSANITHKTLDNYSDGELAYTIRRGITREGRYIGPFMEHTLMSDEDITAIISFLRSDHPINRYSEFTPPPADWSFLAKVLIAGVGIFKPTPDGVKPWPHPDPADPVSHGRYLANVRLGCGGCHSAGFDTNDLVNPEKSVNFFGGGNPVHKNEHSDVVYSANITMHPEDGIGKWTEEQFRVAVTGGLRPDNKPLDPAMPRFNFLSDEETHALWSYLKTVPVLEDSPEK